MITLATDGIRLAFDPGTGLLESFVVADGGVEVAPLHRAPWVGTDEAMPPDAPPLMKTLGGDFFCAPFAASEAGSPFHGWPPNAPWRIEENAGNSLQAVQSRPVYGATLTKTLTLRPGHPFVYQQHVFTDGTGSVPVANHANISLPNGGFIRTSPKTHWETPRDPQESDPAMGRSGLVYPAASVDPTAFPGADGPVDLTQYPWNPRHEDFVVGVEAPGHRLGWTAVTRPVEGDLYLSLRDARKLPMTMLWHSNGGRDYPPWSGRHFGCLGVEEGAAAHMLGLSSPADLAGPGAVELRPGSSIDVRHVIGAIHWPDGDPIRDIEIVGQNIELTGENGARRSIPIDAAFL